jgi:hypothetical protein
LRHHIIILRRSFTRSHSRHFSGQENGALSPRTRSRFFSCSDYFRLTSFRSFSPVYDLFFVLLRRQSPLRPPAFEWLVLGRAPVVRFFQHALALWTQQHVSRRWRQACKQPYIPAFHPVSIAIRDQGTNVEDRRRALMIDGSKMRKRSFASQLFYIIAPDFSARRFRWTKIKPPASIVAKIRNIPT